MIWLYVIIGASIPSAFLAGVAFRYFFYPPKFGKWIDEHWVGTTRHACWTCSECKVKQMFKTSYCPYCGARMDGGKE